MNRRMWITVICGLILGVLYLTGRLSQTAGLVIGSIVVITLLIGSLENEMRYGTGQLISPTVRGSIDLETMLKVGDWHILPRGTVKSEAWNIFTKGGQGTVVFKKTKNDGSILYRVGENALLLAAPKRVDELDLPGDVREVIAGRRGYGPPYFLADKPLNPDPINPNPKWDTEAVRSENAALRRERNIYKDAYHGKTGMIDRELGRITGAARSMEFSRWKRWFGGARKDEETPPGG